MKARLFILLAAFVTLSAQAQVSVVVHPSNSAELDKVEVSRIFLGKSKSFPNGSEAVPVSLADGSAGQAEFNEKVLNKSASQLKAYWSKLVFTGKGTPPKAVDTDADVLELVANNPNLVGYITGAPTDNVKVIATF